MNKEYFNGVGRRKNSTARVYLSDGKGKVSINNVSDNINIYRNDKSEAGINKNEFIENCPETFGNYIKVPKVLDKDK